MAGGRPTKITKEVLAILEQAFALGCTDHEACLMADINPATLYRYQDANKDFCDRKARLKETPVLKARTQVLNAINEGDTLTARWLLERRKSDEFGAKQEIDHKSSDGSMSPGIDASKLSDQALKEFMAAKDGINK